MSDNVEEVQESTPEPQEQVEAQPQQQPQEPQNLSEQPQEGGHIRPENIPEKFWNAETGEIRTDELLKSNAHLEQFVGGKKEELRDQIMHLAFGKKYLTACRFCNGRDYATANIPSAIQAKSKLDYEYQN